MAGYSVAENDDDHRESNVAPKKKNRNLLTTARIERLASRNVTRKAYRKSICLGHTPPYIRRAYVNKNIATRLVPLIVVWTAIRIIDHNRFTSCRTVDPSLL